MFDAMVIPDFRRLWFGSLISNIGSWMQLIGSGWLVLQLTNSPFWLGVVSLMSAIPILGFSLLAGVIADCIDRRRLLMAAQGSAGVFALILAMVTSLGVVNMGEILALTFVTATAMAFTMPAWQAMIPDLVGKERLMNAVGLNSAAYNGAAVIGPALAGVTVSAFGVAACFYLNAISYLAVVWALWRICTPCAGADCTSSVRDSLGAGVRYIRTHRIVFALFFLATVASLLARPYTQLMPVFARTILHGGPSTYGILMAANGIGALIGALVTAALDSINRKGLLLLGSMTGFGAALIVFALAHQFVVALLFLTLVGGGTTLYMGATNTLLQTTVPDEVRGRIMSIYSMIAAGIMPLGGLLLGAAASISGNISLVVVIGAAAVIVSAGAVLIGAPALRKVT